LYKKTPIVSAIFSAKTFLKIRTSVPGFCRFGDQCVEAHSSEELREWKDRFEFRQKKAQKAAKLYGKSFADTVLDKLSAAKNKESVIPFLLFLAGFELTTHTSNLLSFFYFVAQSFPDLASHA
jgi:hypothetical protein